MGHVKELFNECERVNHETVRVVLKDARYLETKEETESKRDQEHFYQNQEEKRSDN